MTQAATALLFSYDSLRETAVQLDTMGRVPTGEDDVLAGFTVDYAERRDRRADDPALAVGPILRRTGNHLDKVMGRVLEVTDAELDACDEYEEIQFRRVPVVLASGRRAWVYVAV